MSASWRKHGEPDHVLNVLELERGDGEPLVHPEDSEPRRGLDRVGGVPGIEDEDRLVHGVRQFAAPERADRQETRPRYRHPRLHRLP